MKFIKILLLLLFSSLLTFAQQKDTEYYEKLDKAFEIYGAVFKILNRNYVVKIDPEALMEKGVQGMLDALDPYSEFISSSESSNTLDIIQTGTYTGFGIIAGTVDDNLTVMDIFPYSPNRYTGLRVGDKIYKIDTTVMLNKNNADLHKFSDGTPGTSVHVYVLRDGIQDTLEFTLTREIIHVKDIPYYKIFDDGIAYIKISRFSNDLISEFKEVLAKLQNKGKLKGIIIDVANNPGGLLMSAVDVCGLFLPKGTVIVTTRGRNSSDDYTIKNMKTPVDTNLPLAVIINGNSASASEILAGAMQDLDRAVIIGQRSYGKGLVQSVTELPYDGYLKYTTAKYYIPSGRCIQKLDYSIAKEDGGLGLHHDSVFYTKNHRPVGESSGIEPDIKISPDTLNNYQEMLLDNFCFFKFANFYTAGLDTLPLDFEPSEETIKEFKDYLIKNDKINDKSIENRLKEVEEEISQYSLNKNINKKLDKLMAELQKEKDYQFNANLDFIKKYLRLEILHRFYSTDEIKTIEIEKKKSVKEARSILKSEKYFSILSKNKSDLN